MEQILRLYKDNEDWINLIKDLIYFLGAFALVKYLWNWNFVRKTEKIATNLQLRQRLEGTLEKHVIQKNKNGIKDIGIRFIHWKNYPRKLRDDAYKHLLKLEYHDGKLLGSSWLDNTGVYFQEHLWFYSTSVYVDKNGIFFFAPSGQLHEGFSEHQNKRLVMHMPYANIVNFDFKEIIEYEPIFYIKYPYTKCNKLYDIEYIIREKFNEPYSYLELNRKKKINRYSWIAYKVKKLRLRIGSIAKMETE